MLVCLIWRIVSVCRLVSQLPHGKISGGEFRIALARSIRWPPPGSIELMLMATSSTAQILRGRVAERARDLIRQICQARDGANLTASATSALDAGRTTSVGRRS